MVSILTSGGPARADTWRGTAPFCSGECLPGEEQIGRSDDGDGAHCVTGHKVLCRNRQAQCQGRETKTSCYGVVMICENGYHESLNQNWHGCNSYACGACFGISIDSIHPQSTAGGHAGAAPPVRVLDTTCKQGFVWREAIKDDHICVTPQTRTQAAADNRAAAGRRAGGGASGPDTCKQGFVWREVVPSDHVCVAPAIRAAAAADAAQARARLAH